MRGAPRSLEEWLYYKLMRSDAFHRFVRRIYYKVNGIKDPSPADEISRAGLSFHPTRVQKLNAYRILFLDEMRGSFGLKRNARKYFKN